MRLNAAFLLVLLLGCSIPPEPADRSASDHAIPAAEPSTEALPPELAEAFTRLDRELSPGARDTLRATPPERLSAYHFGLGMYLRNEYGLWRGGVLQRYLLSKGVQQPDDMSGVLIKAYHRYLRGEPIQIDSLVAAIEPPPPIIEQEPEP